MRSWHGSRLREQISPESIFTLQGSSANESGGARRNPWLRRSRRLDGSQIQPEGAGVFAVEVKRRHRLELPRRVELAELVVGIADDGAVDAGDALRLEHVLDGHRASALPEGAIADLRRGDVGMKVDDHWHAPMTRGEFYWPVT